MNKEKKGKHGGIILYPDSYKNEKKKLHLVDIEEKWFLTFSNPSDSLSTIREPGAVVARAVGEGGGGGIAMYWLYRYVPL